MKLCWIISEDTPPGLLDPAVINDTAMSWGSWQRQQDYGIANCVCTNDTDAKTLVEHNFQNKCTLYITQDSFIEADKPSGVKAFNGHFANSEISNKDDIVSMQLAVPHCHLVLLSGFNFADDHPRREYYYNVREIIRAHVSTQFVLIDYPGDLPDWLSELDNVTQDTADSVKSLLG